MYTHTHARTHAHAHAHTRKHTCICKHPPVRIYVAVLLQVGQVGLTDGHVVRCGVVVQLLMPVLSREYVWCGIFIVIFNQ
jgi:hypothetical protein